MHILHVITDFSSRELEFDVQNFFFFFFTFAQIYLKDKTTHSAKR